MHRNGERLPQVLFSSSQDLFRKLREVAEMPQMVPVQSRDLQAMTQGESSLSQILANSRQFAAGWRLCELFLRLYGFVLTRLSILT